MVTELVGKADREAKQKKVRQHRGWPVPRPSSPLRWRSCSKPRPGGRRWPFDDLWELIEAVVPRTDLQAAIAAVTEMVPPDDPDNDGEMRARTGEPHPGGQRVPQDPDRGHRVRRQRRSRLGAGGHETHAPTSPEPAQAHRRRRRRDAGAGVVEAPRVRAGRWRHRQERLRVLRADPVPPPSTPSRRPDGETHEPNCSTARLGLTPRGRCSPRCRCGGTGRPARRACPGPRRGIPGGGRPTGGAPDSTLARRQLRSGGISQGPMLVTGDDGRRRRETGLRVAERYRM